MTGVRKERSREIDYKKGRDKDRGDKEITGGVTGGMCEV